MPPRIPISQAKTCLRPSNASQTPPQSLVSLFAAISIQSRNANILADLRDTKGAYHKRIRVGRGPSSGYGKTSGRGHNGQLQKGKIKPWFQGGQTPLIQVRGRKGIDNVHADEMAKLNLDRLQHWIDTGRIDPTKRITPYEIYHSGLITNLKDGIKLLARGKEDLRTKIDIMVSRASGSAIAAIEAAGGKITTRYYTAASMKRLIRGEALNTDKPLPVGEEHVENVMDELMSMERAKQRRMYRLPDPTSRWDLEYYRDPAHRGYLSDQLAFGESPSLFYKVPGNEIVVVQKKKKMTSKAAAAALAEARDLW